MPERSTVIVANDPPQMVAEPLMVAVGNGFTVDVTAVLIADSHPFADASA